MIQRFPLEPVSNDHTNRLAERGFTVVTGFDDEVAGALHEGAKDPVVREFTDDETRFATLDTTFEWHDVPEQEPAVYGLKDLADAAIRGIVWFRTSNIDYSTAPFTFALRMYEGARGKGLAGDFIEATHENFTEEQGGGSTWLKVRKGNEAAIVLYKKHGYEIVYNGPDAIIMERIKS